MKLRNIPNSFKNKIRSRNFFHANYSSFKKQESFKFIRRMIRFAKYLCFLSKLFEFCNVELFHFISLPEVFHRLNRFTRKFFPASSSGYESLKYSEYSSRILKKKLVPEKFKLFKPDI